MGNQSFKERVERYVVSPVPWRIEVVDATASTNSDLTARLRSDRCAEYTVLVALDQARGKGRLTRAWTVPPSTSVAMSMAVPLEPYTGHWGLIPVASGVAVVRALADMGARAQLKWPNDVLIEGLKVCGILVEVAEKMAVIGVGVNVLQTTQDIGFPTATSLKMAGVEVTREEVVGAILTHIADTLGLITADDTRHTLMDTYRGMSATIGQQVRVFLNEDTHVEGHAIDVAEDGQLLVEIDGEVRGFASGDVFHLRT